MQVLKMYSIFDSAAGAYLTPFFMANDLVAIRAFGSVVAEPGQMFYAAPQDFTLFCLGRFDATQGTVELEASPRAVRNGLAVVAKPPAGPQQDMFEKPVRVENMKKGDGDYKSMVAERSKP